MGVAAFLGADIIIREKKQQYLDCRCLKGHALMKLAYKCGTKMGIKIHILCPRTLLTMDVPTLKLHILTKPAAAYFGSHLLPYDAQKEQTSLKQIFASTDPLPHGWAPKSWAPGAK